jgi:hypothetical protein
MSSSDPSKPIEIKRNLLSRFYEPLLLLNTIDSIRGPRIKADSTENNNNSNHQKRRRSFADGIAYICAYKKDPDYVTAVALERTPGGINVWIAANSHVEDIVVRFLEDILQELSGVAMNGEPNQRTSAAIRIQLDLTSKIVSFNTPRIQAYFRLTKAYVQSCLPEIRNACQLMSQSPGKS